MKILIACGGTGGHLFPGLAVAETLQKRRHEVKLLVSEKAVDQAALNHATIPVKPVGAVGYTGAGSLFKFCYRLAQAVGDCVTECRQFEPDAVLGMGGFTSAPAILAANCRRLIHESNAVPGKANRWTGKLADHIAVGVPDCAKFFGHKPVTVTGTPIRQALRHGKVTGAHAKLSLDPSRLTVLVMGGSQGAQAINTAVTGALPALMAWKDRLQFVHLAGTRDEVPIRAAYAIAGFAASVMSFCSEMELPYSAADLVIARSGAVTLTELAVFGLPALLLPYPHAAGNHQWFNAKFFERRGAARIVNSPADLPEEIGTLLDDAGARAAMAAAVRTLAVSDAAERIADLVETYAN